MSKERDHAASVLYSDIAQLFQSVGLEYYPEVRWVRDPKDLARSTPVLEKRLISLAEAFHEQMRISSLFRYDKEIERLGCRMAAILRAKELLDEKDSDVLSEILEEYMEELEAIVSHLGETL